MDATWNAIKQNVQEHFAQIREAVDMREKLLLRQIDVIAASQKQSMAPGTTPKAKVKKTSSNYNNNENSTNANTSDSVDKKPNCVNVKFISNEKNDLLVDIRSFGRFELDNINLALQDIYLKNEDYITPINDHEIMYKCLQTVENAKISFDDENDEHPESIVVDFSKNKSLIEHNRKNANKSIINITLQEAKDLIRHAKLKRETPAPPLNLEELDDELESSIAEAVSCLNGGNTNSTNGGIVNGVTTTVPTKSSQTCSASINNNKKKNKKTRFKPKITINNCNGTINLRNISSLTINCATEESLIAELPIINDTTESVGLEEEQSSSLFLSQRKHENMNDHANSGFSDEQLLNMETTSSNNTTPLITSCSSSDSSNSSSRSQSKKQKNKKKQTKNTSKPAAGTTATSSSSGTAEHVYVYQDEDDDEDNVATCDFYNRLLNEIKNSLKEKTKRNYCDNIQYLISSNNVAPPSTNVDSSTDGNSNIYSSTAGNSGTGVGSFDTKTASSWQGNKNKRLVLKNFENLRIILEANGDEDSVRPVQIEQWLAEIISDTDLEPMQNTDILEHSKIHNDEQ